MIELIQFAEKELKSQKWELGRIETAYNQYATSMKDIEPELFAKRELINKLESQIEDLKVHYVTTD